jgi:ketosteroid isomerase-like protein
MEQVADFFSLYKDFAWKKDSAGMSNLYEENVIIFDMWHKDYYSGLKEWSGVIAQWLGSLNDERVKVSFEKIEIHSGESVSFASAIVGYQALSADNEVLRGMKNRITLGFKKTGTGWKVMHQHTSAPIDNDLRAILGE